MTLEPPLGSPRRAMRESLWARGSMLRYPGSSQLQQVQQEWTLSERTHRAMTARQRQQAPGATARRGRFVLQNGGEQASTPRSLDLKPGETWLEALREVRPLAADAVLGSARTQRPAPRSHIMQGFVAMPCHNTAADYEELQGPSKKDRFAPGLEHLSLMTPRHRPVSYTHLTLPTKTIV